MKAISLGLVLLLAAFFIMTGACMGGGFITRPELIPPPISEARAAPLAERAGVPMTDPISVTPAVLRVYPTHPEMVIVDVMAVVNASEEWWSEEPSAAEDPEESLATARFYTNGFGVPAEFRSRAHEDGPAIEIRGADGRVLKGTRALLGVPPFEINHPWLLAREFREEVRVVELERVGRPYRVHFQPILLGVDAPLTIGAWYDVRIVGDHRDTNLDRRWYRMRAEEFGKPEAGGG